MAQEHALAARPDGRAVAQLAAVLVRDSGSPPQEALRHGLDLLVRGLRLRTAVLRDAEHGAVLATAGGVVRAVSGADGSSRQVVELPVHRLGGREVAVLTVSGVRPGTLPSLRTAAAVLGLALGDAAHAEPAHAGPLVEEPLAVALLADAEADRADLADELHDGAAQDLLVARYAADAAARAGDAAVGAVRRGPGAAPGPGTGRDEVQKALVTLRRTLWHLRPRGADDLAAALTSLSDRLVDAGRRSIAVRADPGVDALLGTPATTAYRLVQALALAPSPSAGPLVVALARSARGVVMDVGGAPPLPDPERWQRRARALGGELSGAGGRVRLTLPAPLDPAPRCVPLRPPVVPDPTSPTPKATP